VRSLCCPYHLFPKISVRTKELASSSTQKASEATESSTCVHLAINCLPHLRASFQFPNQPPTPNYQHWHQHQHHNDDDNKDNSQSPPRCTSKPRRALLARQSRERTGHSRSIPTSPDVRGARSVYTIPILHTRDDPARGALRVARGRLARHPSLRRRIPAYTPYALDGAPRAVRAQKVAGEFRAARACARY
jgi:hypothetical protein